MKKRVLCVAAAMILLLGLMTGCTGLPADDASNPLSDATDREQEDVNEIFRSLLVKSVRLNIAVADELALAYGEDSIILEGGSSISSGGKTYTLECDYYMLKNPKKLHALGIYSLADLRTKTEEIYTAACAEETRYYAVPDEAILLDSPACVEYEGALYRKGVSWMMVDGYDFDTIQLVEKTDTSATFDIWCVDWNGEVSEDPLTIVMLKTAQGWRLDNCNTYTTFKPQD